MKYFSAMERLHLFVAAEYGCALSITSHGKWYSVFDSLSFHMNSLQVVADFFVVKSKARCMLIVSGFELIFCYFYVSVLFLFHSCLVFHSLLEALAFEWAGFFIPAVASFSLFFFYLCRFKDCFVVAINYLFHILHATIA